MKKLLLIGIVVLAGIKVNAQCCSAGNPAGGDGTNDGLNKNELRIATSFKHSLSKDYYNLDKKTVLPYIAKSYYDFTALSISYGILPRLTINTEIGYFIDKTQIENVSSQNDVIKAHGLGDLAFSLRYKLIKTVKPITQMVISAGMKLPIGAFNEEIDGVTIPISLQPSSGALIYNASLFYSRKHANHKYGWKTFAMVELSNFIEKGYLIYKYGNYYQFSLAATYTLHKKMLFIGNAKLEFRGHDTRESNIKIESSGSRIVYFNPQFQYTFKKNWSLICMTDIPVYKYVNGSQLTNKYSFSIAVFKTLNLKKKPASEIPKE